VGIIASLYASRDRLPGHVVTRHPMRGMHHFGHTRRVSYSKAPPQRVSSENEPPEGTNPETGEVGAAPIRY